MSVQKKVKFIVLTWQSFLQTRPNIFGHICGADLATFFIR